MEFQESGIQFIFDDQQWSDTFQFDTHGDYIKLRNCVTETKAIDFIGIHKDELYLFEIKGFRGCSHQSSVRTRLANGAEDLTTEIAWKVRDSVACIMGAARNSTNAQLSFLNFCQCIQNPQKVLHIIAWIEEDIQPGKVGVQRQKVKNSTRLQKLKTKLSWLSKRVQILSLQEFNASIPGLQVSYLPKSTP